MLAGLALLPLLLAVPPRAPFPANVTPSDGAVLPSNGRVLAYSSDVVQLDAIGVVASVDGASVAPALSLLGCCAVVVDFAAAGLVDGQALSLTLSGGESVADLLYAVGPPDTEPPSLVRAAFVQVVTAQVIVPPLPPQVGPGYIVTIDIEGAADDRALVALSATDASGTLLAVEAPAGAVVERLRAGIVADGAVCIDVQATDVAGAVATTQACGLLEVQQIDEEPPPADAPRADSGGCAQSGAAPVWMLLVGAVFLRLRSRAPASALALTLPLALLSLGTACDAPPGEDAPDAGARAGVCADAFADHSMVVDTWDDATFAQHARAQFGWLALKVLVLHPHDEARAVAGILDSDFYALHDNWFAWRLVHGEPACGASEISPLAEPQSFRSFDELVAWARTLDRLPPFLSWLDDRLYCPDFYRLAREVEPPVYVPAYLTRDQPDASLDVWRVGPGTALSVPDVEAMFAVLGRHTAPGRTLVWQPSRTSDEQLATADGMTRDGHPLAARIVRPATR